MAGKKKGKKGRKGKKRVEVRYVEARAPEQGGMLSSLTRLLPEKTSERFLVGALAGGAIAYGLSDEAARASVLRFAIRTYGDVVGALAEIREQAADIQAEIQAGQHEA